MLVPTLMKQLNEPHAALGQSPRHQAVEGVASLSLHIGPVGFERGRRFRAKVDEFRNRSLHPAGEFVLSDSRLNFPIAGLLELQLVELAEIVEHRPPRVAIDAVADRKCRAPVRLDCGTSLPDKPTAESRFPTGGRTAAAPPFRSPWNSSRRRRADRTIPSRAHSSATIPCWGGRESANRSTAT